MHLHSLIMYYNVMASFKLNILMLTNFNARIGPSENLRK